MIRFVYVLFLILVLNDTVSAQANGKIASSRFTIARLKYGGGGDWYGNKNALNHLLRYLSDNTNIAVEKTETYVDPSDIRLFDYTFLYMAGHGNVKFSDEDVRQLRRFLTGGGFLWCDDDYGIDPYFRREMKRIFPELDFTLIPFTHPIYSIGSRFPNGMPKIHEHDGGPPQGYGLFWKGRLICFYSKNTDISDGLEGPEVFPEDHPEKQAEALRFAANIVMYALSY